MRLRERAHFQYGNKNTASKKFEFIVLPAFKPRTSVDTHDTDLLLDVVAIGKSVNASTTEEPRSANELPSPEPNAGQRSALRSLARRYRARRRRPRPDHADPAERRKRKRAKLLDCRVSEWAEWSECRGEGCVGSALRTRRVIRRQRPGGAPCPPTAQSRWCTKNCTAPPEVYRRDDLS
ncbi:Spondin-1 [Eumeta japonica]|uniref:Spondin-1 n=1 Tax=Eumeta variegata TaxID=151549 RepID=A0A4C1WL00_EUMVA|nr:Spondin-1 [Eumeta japonica]